MFKREDFDYQISSAERYAASADENPENTKMALFHMIEAMKYLADSCENDQQDALKSSAEKFSSR